MTNRSPERVQFLKDILITAVEGGINYWAEVGVYDPDNGTAFIYETEEDDAVGTAVNIDTIAHGISILTSGENKLRHFTMSGHDYWQQFLMANETNGEDGDYDADIADNILQAGMFGEIVYG